MQQLIRSAVVTALVAGTAVAATFGGSAAAIAPAEADVFISELHYDNSGDDVGETVEVFGPAGTDLTGWSIELYNGNGGASYGTTVLTGTIDDESAGYGVSVTSYPSNGIQNGGPDGIALVDDTGTVRQFLSYEGAFAAVGGSADGMMSTDIGVSEIGTTPIGESLQLAGTGSCLGALTWQPPAANTFGSVAPIVPDDTVDCGDTGGADPADAHISELHYDNDGADIGEAVEVTGNAGGDLSGWSIALYNGNGGGAYGTISLSGTLSDEADGIGVATFEYSGIQNGSPDGLALVDPDGAVVEFLSYEGVFDATDGPATGMTSTDIGVSEGSSSPASLSLQRFDDVWSGPACASFGSLNIGNPPATCPEPSEVVINATLISTTGADDPEWVELYGTPGFSLAGLSVIGVESDAGASNGTIDHQYDLPDGAVLGDNGFFLLGNPSVEPELGATPDFDIPNNGLENSSITVALVETASISGNTAADVAAVLDSVGVTDGETADQFAFGAPVVGPDGTFLPAGARRIEDGVDTDTAGDWEQLVYSPRNDPANVPTAGGTDGGVGEEPVEVKIHEVQGSGSASPLEGQRVIVEGIVVGDHEGPSPALGGFFVQEEDVDVDADPATSEGVFVYNGSADSVSIGDLVQVEGTVEERFDHTQLSDFAEITVLSNAQPLPSPAIVEFPTPSADALEDYEGMLATFPQELVISEYFNYDRFGEIVVALPTAGTDRPMIPTAVHDEDSPEAAALADLNERSRITVDDGITAQNPESPVHPINRELFSLDNDFRGGDTVSGITGPVFFDFSLYRVLPYSAGDAALSGLEGYATFEQTEAPATPPEVGGDLTVASLNALNYFVTLDDGSYGADGGGNDCGPDRTMECRGADAAELDELSRQTVKLVNTLVGLDADVIGLNEVENTAGVESLAAIVDAVNADGRAGTYDYIVAGDDSVVGSDAIKVGVIYRPAAVSPLGDAAILDTPEFLDPNSTGSPKNRAAVAQTFVDSASGEVFSVVVNHLKSKGSGCGAGDDHPLAGSCNTTRTLAAEMLADWVVGDPTGVDDDDWLIIGDLNSYDQEDPIDALRDAGYSDLVGEYQGEFAYSYVFDGEFGYLDYAMSSESMTAQVTGAAEWHINADTPDVFDYDTSFKSDYQDSLFDPATPYRSSDHDAALVGLSLSSFDATTFALPGVLWPANHRLRSAYVFSLNRNGLVDSAIVGAVSSEADAGLGRGDRPGDIQLVDDYRIELRAEAFDRAGRTYEIHVQLSEPGQVRFDTTTVKVRRPGGWFWWL